ncbi:hypothetical protein [Streptomyces cinereospinus]|uniref:Uncharacterized protein n=1 Tax=Streptomyces cinereospinus TaxID=285561 RepID=A0ABV5N003_9ACTN
MTLRYPWWGGEPRSVAIEKTVALLGKEVPETAIKPEFTECEAFLETFQPLASGGNPPDVFRNAVAFLRKHDERGVLMDLTSQADAAI